MSDEFESQSKRKKISNRRPKFHAPGVPNTLSQLQQLPAESIDLIMNNPAKQDEPGSIQDVMSNIDDIASKTSYDDFYGGEEYVDIDGNDNQQTARQMADYDVGDYTLDADSQQLSVVKQLHNIAEEQGNPSSDLTGGQVTAPVAPENDGN